MFSRTNLPLVSQMFNELRCSVDISSVRKVMFTKSFIKHQTICSVATGRTCQDFLRNRNLSKPVLRRKCNYLQYVSSKDFKPKNVFSRFGNTKALLQTSKRSMSEIPGEKFKFDSEREMERLTKKKESLLEANQRIREKGQTMLKDLKETQHKMRERVEEIILKDNPWTIPNLLCVMRMGSAPVLAYMIVNCQYGPAIFVFALAGVSDLLDGWIARMYPSQSSVMGSFLDPLADKILVATLFLSLTYMDLIPVPLTALIIARDAALIAAGFYIRYQSLEPPITFTRYFDVTHASAQLAPTLLSKINTGIQLGLVGSTLLSTVLPWDMTTFLTVLWVSTAGTTIGSAVSYLMVKDTVKFLRKKKNF